MLDFQRILASSPAIAYAVREYIVTATGNPSVRVPCAALVPKAFCGIFPNLRVIRLISIMERSQYFEAIGLLSTIATFTTVTALHIERTTINWSLLVHVISALPNLRSLYLTTVRRFLSKGQNDTPKDIHVIPPKLRVLYIRQCSEIFKDLIDWILLARSHTQLHSLFVRTMYRPPQVRLALIALLHQVAYQLEDLDISEHS